MDGRAGVLRLRGKEGSLSIVCVYGDPSCKTQIVKQCQAAWNAVSLDSHCIVAGDFNFVTCNHDRISKKDARATGDNDRAISDKWRHMAESSALQEWEQEHMTCESSFAHSRIDRVYSNVSDAEAICFESFCQTCGHKRHLSDHSPLFFGIRDSKRGNQKGHERIPAWLVQHSSFAEQFKDELTSQLATPGLTSFQKLNAVKAAAKKVSKSLFANLRGQLSCTTQERLSTSICLVRALYAKQWYVAERLQERLPAYAKTSIE